MRTKFGLWEFVEKQLREEPDRVFLIDEPEKKTTLTEFWRLSGRVYAFLKGKGIGYEDVVMFNLPRSSEIYAAMAGTLRAGAAFVCTEAGFSSERSDFIRKDCNCRLYVDETVWREIKKTEPLEGAEPVDLHDKAFISYTSGTTGRTKGAIHEYGTIMLLSGQSLFNKEVLPILPPFDFISDSLLLFKSIFFKSTLAVVPMRSKKDYGQLVSYLKETATTGGYLSPSFLRKHGVPDANWKWLVISSEPVDGIKFKGVENYNLYASTEGGCTLSTYHITEPLSPMPIGKGIVPMKVLREDGTEAETGEKGELCFQQPYFRGYQNLPEKTAEIIRDGWVHSRDQAVRLEDGNLCITGRLDEQFKIGGYIISPEEIRSALNSALGLRNTVVRGFVYKYINSICVFYTDPVEIDQAEAEKKLLKFIPQYMIPTNYFRLASFPMLPTGKIDKMNLLPPEGSWKGFADEAICKSELIGSGRTAEVYALGEKKAVKLFRENFPLRLVVKEQKKAVAAGGVGIPCPKTYGIVRAENRYGIIYESYRGSRTYEEALADDFTRCEPLIRDYIRGVRQMHSVTLSDDTLGTLPDAVAPLYQHAEKMRGVYADNVVEMIVKILRHIPSDNKFLQYDCHIDNCFVTSSGPVFFDFTFSGRGHVILDMYGMYAHLVLWPSAKKRGKLTVEQFRTVFDVFLREYLNTEDTQRLADAERQLKCIGTAIVLLAPAFAPGMVTEAMIEKALADLPDDCAWFCSQVVVG